MAISLFFAASIWVQAFEYPTMQACIEEANRHVIEFPKIENAICCPISGKKCIEIK